MRSRRAFLEMTAAAALAGTRTAHPSTDRSRYSDLEARIAKRDFRDIVKEDLPTPCLVLDRAIFEQNLRKMADHSKATGLKIRPHVKIHKCVDIGKRQIALGAVGLTTATIAESELMSRSGIKGVLWTAQPAGKNKVARAVALSKQDPSFMFIVDDPLVVDDVELAAAASGVRCNVVVDICAGMKRQGMQPGQSALELARKVDSSKRLRLSGIMGYSGDASHTHGWEARRARSQADLEGLSQTVDLCRKSGLPVGIITGGSTGTYNIDTQTGLTELQCGSYIFMDTVYRQVGGKSNPAEYDDFGISLTVMATVISKRYPNRCTIDAGNKAMLKPTDEVKGMPWMKIENSGAEYGSLVWNDGGRELALRERVELYTTNLDMTTNAYDRVYVAEGEKIVDVWPIMGRSGAPQR